MNYCAFKLFSKIIKYKNCNILHNNSMIYRGFELGMFSQIKSILSFSFITIAAHTYFMNVKCI